jgi:hypothetical protein
MITYIEPDPIRLPGWRVPKLHGGKIKKMTADTPMAEMNLAFREVQSWCTENCTGKFYSLPSWSGIGAQFEEEDDWISFSMWARLRWS